MKVFTIGYGGRTKSELLALLKANGVRTVADIRLSPNNAYMGTWVKAKTPDKGIESWLAKENIEYRSFIELGNRFMGDKDWRDRYGTLLSEEGERLTERLRAAPAPYCLLCAEKFATDCHRSLVAAYLADRYGAETQDL
jgi:uncharacterized protein (DUF488 family)